jgi:hypothetical protein
MSSTMSTTTKEKSRNVLENGRMNSQSNIILQLKIQGWGNRGLYIGFEPISVYTILLLKLHWT